MNPTCAACVFWTRQPFPVSKAVHDPQIVDYGPCGRSRGLRGSNPPPLFALESEYPGFATVYTVPEFGCVLHQPKTP